MEFEIIGLIENVKIVLHKWKEVVCETCNGAGCQNCNFLGVVGQAPEGVIFKLINV